ncbi:protein EMSY-LIKE 1-like isoform X2 [Mercurialis annua]|uniref:protein EMSY-LIKE 1-like isoform X2 n=1 Tax=Mercurialis annua TaxID=3986 RepID=UPI00215F693F|nr:protein EMSY-LIKE 1-like isoform X2 [Mercurialis annua]
MDYELCESSGTDDDLPPSRQYLIPKGERILGNGRSSVGSPTYCRKDMEAHIRHLEQEAYSAVLRAFKAQSDAISWEKEHLITELRKELRVSDDQHRELLTRVNGDEIIQSIREWRQAGGHQAARSTASQLVRDDVLSPTVSGGSRKRQKTSLAGQQMPGLSSMKYMQYPSIGPAGNHHHFSHSYSGAVAANDPAEAAAFDQLIGRKVLTRWPDDNSFYEAEIISYNPSSGKHYLVYDKGAANATFEWVDLKEISPEDIQWVDEDPGISLYSVHGGPGRGVKKSSSHGGVSSVGRGRGSVKSQNKREYLPPQNGFAKMDSDDIELLNTESLVQEVEKVFSLSHPDPLELEKAKKMLKEHEQALVEAIARLADASDVESED